MIRFLERLGDVIAKAATVVVLLALGYVLFSHEAQAATTTGGVNWLDPLAYKKPQFVPITVPDPPYVDYWVDLTAGGSGSCGTSSGSPCGSFRNLANRSLEGLRGNAADRAARVFVKGTGSAFIFNDTFLGTAGKEIQILPWAGFTATFDSGTGNQNFNGTPRNDYIIFDGGPDLALKFSRSGCSGQCYAFQTNANHITFYRTQWTENTTGGTLLGYCSIDGNHCDDLKVINSEFYDTADPGIQGTAVYIGPCADVGGCSASTVYIGYNIFRNLGGEALELNPRVSPSVGYIVENNAAHGIGFQICTDGKNCRPVVVANINQPAGNSIDGLIVRNNLMWDISSGCFWSRTGATAGANSPQFFGNTCYDFGKCISGSDPRCGVIGTDPQPQGVTTYLCGADSTGTIVRDNIIFAPNGTAASCGVLAANMDHNVCASGSTCGASSQIYSAGVFASTSPSSSTFLTLAPSSVAIGNGVSISGLTIDYGNVSRSSPPDIGAQQFAAAGAPPQPQNFHYIPVRRGLWDHMARW